MEHISIDPRQPQANAVRRAADVLRRGGIVAYPTETFYALGVNAEDDDAVQRLFDVKGRDAASAIALIAADVDAARLAGAFGAQELRLASAFWPGPLTIVVPASTRLSPRLSGDRRTIGVRVSPHPIARALAAAAGTCITATSANRSGHPPTTTADGVSAAFGLELDAIVDGGATPGGAPSTLVEIVDGVPTRHRAGAIAWERVLESL